MMKKESRKINKDQVIEKSSRIKEKIEKEKNTSDLGPFTDSILSPRKTVTFADEQRAQ
jgi:hypothetical protein